MKWWILLPGSERVLILAAIFSFIGLIVCIVAASIKLIIQKIKGGRGLIGFIKAVIKPGPHVTILSGSEGLMLLAILPLFLFFGFSSAAQPEKLIRFINSVQTQVESEGSGNAVLFSSDISGSAGSGSTSWASTSVDSDSGSWDSGGSDSGGWDSGGSDSGSWDSGSSDSGGSDSGSWDSGD